MTEVATLIAVVLKLEGGFLGPSILPPPTNELNDIATRAAHAVLRNLNMN